MDIVAINEILLPPFLLVVAFCFCCCQLPRHSQSKSVDEANTTTIDTTAVAKIDEAILTQEPVENLAPTEEMETVPTDDKPVIDKPIIVMLEPVQEALSSYEQALAAINGLNKVQLRKLCKPLGIQQKCNGVELTKELMAAAVKKVLRSDEQLVIATISQKLDIQIAVASQSVESVAIA